MISDLIFFLRLDTVTGFRVFMFEEMFRGQGEDHIVVDFWMKRYEKLGFF